MFNGKYRIYTDGENKVVAVSSYAGKTVRGVAKCDPRDTFSAESGRALAEARCAVKIADRRHARARKEYAKALAELNAKQARFEKMCSYLTDAATEVAEADQHLQDVIKGL